MTKCNNCNCNKTCCEKNCFKTFKYNVCWVFKEFIKIFSNKDSFFSKKRIESGLAFLIMQIGMILYFIKNVNTMDIYDLSLWACIEGVISGYTMNVIQREKMAFNNKHDYKNEEKTQST